MIANCRLYRHQEESSETVKRTKLVLTAGASIALASCGQPLGTYEVEALTVTENAPKPEGVRAPNYGRYVKVALSSETNLTAIADHIASVYAHADFCPFSDPYFLTTFGPFSSGDADLEVPSSAKALERAPDGKFHYNVYIVPRHRMPDIKYSRSADARESYDIESDGRDICIRFDAPGYDIVKSRSKMIRISHDDIRDAFASAS
ncbi:hypothetical protein [Paraurantiacibacter namhicola]|uniref:Uncharacterized protein n=1 Tax=Paraurantiacibacter namhicola TaxID=645517 RepID=A0A1C7D6I3_9SPHN|nr:hypothetical protein [Paraurantiacibacter namhicola]ANU06962.1 hypothetical protein A6F65_00640 [Paraurantiacibacter namhicola]